MTQNEKALSQLKSLDIDCKIENNTVYVYCGDTPLEISEFEIKFRAHLYKISKIELP
tara:strand:+ start:3998 stop:4168 length:171 start_codon:yes stop_codon:yes gene_type:complete